MGPERDQRECFLCVMSVIVQGEGERDGGREGGTEGWRE